MDNIDLTIGNIVAALALISIGVLARGIYEKIRRRRALRHVFILLGRSSRPRVHVVFPSSKVAAPETAPSNVLWMSLPEGAAIARIGQVCRDARATTEMQLIHPSELRDKDGSFVLIGGPDANDWSKQWVEAAFPQLRVERERHRVRYDASYWHSQIAGGMVQTDLGFLILGRTERSNPFVMLWGTSELGTNIAARAYCDLSSLLNRQRFKEISDGHNSHLLVVRGDIEGYGVKTNDLSNVRVVATFQGN